MTCNNMVKQHVGRRKPHSVRCGLTGYDGNVAICDRCLNDPERLAEIERREALIAEDNAWSHSAGWGDW